jgi:outer membrane protein assembly factor BamE
MNTAFYLGSCGALALALAGCKSVEMPKVPGITPYRMVIQQGNFISQEMVAQLKPGMTREQVRFILGTPLVTDIFHADRWDYVFVREAEGKREQRNLSVIFEKDRLARVIGDLMPADAPAQATGFSPLLKPEPVKPAADAKPAAKPADEPAKAAEIPASPADPAKPAAAAPRPAESWEPTKQNWGSAPPPPEAEKKPAAQEAKAPEEKKAEDKPADPAEKPVEEAKERGFFGRMLEKIGL